MMDPKTLRLYAEHCENDQYEERHLDCDIAEAMMGGTIEWKQTQYTGESYPMRKYSSPDHTKGYGYESVPHFTTSMDAAYALVPTKGYGAGDGVWRMYLTNIGYTHGVWLKGKTKAVVYHPLSSGPESYVGIASTMARALAAAALRAQADFIQAQQHPEPMADQPS